MSAADTIRYGALARAGHYKDDALRLAIEVVEKLEAEGIETIRIVFPDQHGILRGKTITARVLASAFATGVGIPATLILKDTAHRTVFPVWEEGLEIGGLSLVGAGDLLLVPDPASFIQLPWSPHSALLLSDVVHKSGEAVTFAPRDVLKRAVRELKTLGYRAIFGLEVEFQVYRITDPALAHGQATMPPQPVQTENLTQGYQYLTETRYGEAEALLDTLRRNSEAINLAPRSMEVEMGPSQFEFTFDASDALTQANNFVLFRTMVKEVCQAEGFHASFMAKPKLPNAAANGWHIHQSLLDADGENVFMPGADGAVTSVASNWIAGLLDHAEASCILTNPTVNSYKRFTPFQLAPNRIQWGRDNRGAMVRTLMQAGDATSRIENRIADSSANPYFALAAQIFSGLSGIKSETKAPPPTENPYGGEADTLPNSLIAAIEHFERSDALTEAFGSEFVQYLAHLKLAEWDRYLMTVSEWEQSEYFNLL